MTDHTQTLDAIAAELLKWQQDGRRIAADSMVEIAALLHNTGRLADRLPEFHARRDGRLLDR